MHIKSGLFDLSGHLLAHFDYIYMLRIGAIVDQGAFEDLNRYSLVFKEVRAGR